MKIGYPCINWTIGCKGGKTFRLKSYSEKRLVETVTNNLACLSEILSFNRKNNLLFFRITSDLVPFASHPICHFDWRSYFHDELASIGAFIGSNNMRISMHPGQYTVLNSRDNEIVARSIKELEYHANVLDSLDLDTSAKIQLHVGGVYGDKNKSLNRFVQNYFALDKRIKRRLVIENDDRSFNINDCYRIHEETGIPILFDVFHDELNPSDSTLTDIFDMILKTWQHVDGVPMVDYSHYNIGRLKVSHTDSINPSLFEKFLSATQQYDFDIMLEIKDKEASALKAIEIARKDKRFILI